MTSYRERIILKILWGIPTELKRGIEMEEKKTKKDKKDTRSSVRRREPNFFAMYFMNGNSSLCNVGYSGNFSRLIKAGTEKLRAYRLKAFVHVIFIVDNAGVNSKIKLEYLELQNNRKRPLA